MTELLFQIVSAHLEPQFLAAGDIFPGKGQYRTAGVPSACPAISVL
jgi:hypothetical protein